MPNGGAAAAGIKEGDIIKKIGGVEIYDAPDLQEKVGRMRPGDKVPLTVLTKEGSTKNITVTLAPESKVALASAPAKATGANVNKLGASFAPATAAIKSKYKIQSGVVVTSVVPDKLLYNMDVAKGYVIVKVNGKPVNSSADVEKALPTSKDGGIKIEGVGENGYFTISVGGQ